VLSTIERGDVQEHGREEPGFTGTRGLACQRVGEEYVAGEGDLGDGR
jgi:hypothetical protein